MSSATLVDAATTHATQATQYLSPARAWHIVLATALLNETYGRAFNTHMTLQYEGAGISDHAQASEVLSDLNHETKKWLKRQMKGLGLPPEEAAHHFVYVHENARDRGLHTHQLMCLPRGYGPQYERWALGRLAALSPSGWAMPAAIKVVSRHPSTQLDLARRQWRWVGYILKSTEPRTVVADDGQPTTFHDAMKVGRPVPSHPIHCAQMAGSSQSLSKATIRRLGTPAFETWSDLLGDFHLRQFATKHFVATLDV